MKFKKLILLTLTLYSATSLANDNFSVIAHRGASGYLPEHTLEAAALAHAQRPDYIEQDVVMTKDHIAVVLHDIHLETVTNVEEVFPERIRDDGRFYALDFTLAELKTLRVHERTKADGTPVFPNRYQGSAQFSIATLDEHIELITQLNRQMGTNVGFYPEIKSPAWHQQHGADISVEVLKVLRKHQLDSFDKPIYVQCFDHKELLRLRNELGAKLKLVQLVAENSWGESPTDYDWLKSAEGIASVASVAQGIGPWLGQLIDNEALKAGQLAVQPWLEHVKQANLIVHPYTFRVDALPPGMTTEQLFHLIKNVIKADGVFTDQVPPVNGLLEKP